MKVFIKTRILRPEVLELDGLRIGVLKVEDEEWGETRIRDRPDKTQLVHSLYSLAANRTYKAVKSRGGFVETEASGVGVVALDADGRYRNSREMLMPKPSRLLRIGILWGEEPRRNIGMNDFEWFDVSRLGEYYVYEGFIESEKPWSMIVIDTEAGKRIILPGENALARRTYRLFSSGQEKKSKRRGSRKKSGSK